MSFRRGPAFFISLVLLSCLATPSQAGIFNAHPDQSGQQPNPATLPGVKRDTLLNGLTLLVVEQPGTAKVVVHLRINSGATFDLAGKGGLADVTAGMLLRGTSGLSAKETSEFVNQLGLTLNIQVNWDATDIIVGGSSQNFDNILDLLGRLILKPSFDAKELDSFKGSRVTELLAEKSTAASTAAKTAVGALYGSYPFGRPAEGTADSVAKISRDDVEYYHHKFYLPNNSELYVEGDVTADDVTHEARAKLGLWAKGQVARATFQPPVPISSNKIVILNQPDVSQPAAVLAQIGVSRQSADYFANLIAARVISEIASKRDTVSGAQYRSILDARILPGPLFVEIESSPEKLSAAVDAGIAAMTSVVQGDVPADIVNRVKQEIVADFESKISTPEGSASALLDIEQYGLGRDYILNFSDRVNAVSADEITAAARAHLKPGALVIAVVGPASQIEGPMRKIGPVSVLK